MTDFTSRWLGANANHYATEFLSVIGLTLGLVENQEIPAPLFVYHEDFVPWIVILK